MIHQELFYNLAYQKEQNNSVTLTDTYNKVNIKCNAKNDYYLKVIKQDEGIETMIEFNSMKCETLNRCFNSLVLQKIHILQPQ